MNSTNNAAQPSPEDGQGLYAKRHKIYPRKVHGNFENLRIFISSILLGMYYIFPWLQWDDRQVVLFDLPARQFYVFGLVFWPQDFIYLAFLLIIAAVSLFFFTTLAGRLWCGLACPQTVWTDAFIRIERWVEGDRAQRIKLDKAPWSFRKIRIIATKHAIWIIFSLFTGFTFVGYFTPIRELYDALLAYNLGGWETFWFFFYSFATYGNAGGLREQICVYMCPYARFQSAMFDKNTLIIAYDEKRGEPRGQRKMREDPKSKGLGDCINCTLCVQACPAGIDIRDGLQYQCISCTACIDACDEVMDKVGYPRGLVRYTTENHLNGTPEHVLRPRVFIYGSIILAVIAGMFYAIAVRDKADLDIIRDRNVLFRETNDGLIENVYTLRVMNKDVKPHTYQVTIEGLEGSTLETDSPTIDVMPGKVREFGAHITVSPENIQQRSNIVSFTLTSTDEPTIIYVEEGRFVGPVDN